MTVAVIPQDGTEPIASFPDMETALAWGLQQYKGQPFVVRVFAQDAEAGAEAKGAEVTTQRRRPAAKAAAVATVLQAARRAAQKEFVAKETSRQRVVAH